MHRGGVESKVLLINPPAPFLAIPNAAPHLGLGYLISYLRENGVTVDYANYETADPAKIELPEGYNYYGFTATTPQYHFAKILREQAAERRLGKTVIGGAHASLMPQGCLKDGFDFAVKGYGEDALLSIIQGKNKGKIIQGTQVDDLDALSPAWDELYKSEYSISYGEKTAHVFSVRGCPYGCYYCSAAEVYGNEVGFRSPEAVVQEIQNLIDKYGITNVYFFDPTFTLRRDRTVELARQLGDLGINWTCQTRVDRIDAELLVRLKQGGCDRISFGVEAGSTEVHGKLGKGTTVNQNELAIKMAHDAGLKVKTYLMGALPEDNHSTAEQFKEFIIKNKPDSWLFSTFIPILGTDYWRNPQKYGIDILCNDFRAFYPLGLNGRGPVNIRNSYLTREQLKGLRDDLLDFLRKEIPDARVEKAIADFPEQRKRIEPYFEGLNLDFLF